MIQFIILHRVPTVMENPGEKSGHGKSWKIVKIQNVMEICLPGKNVIEKSWKSVVQIHLIVFLLCCDQCGSRLYSSVSLITTIVLHLCYTYTKNAMWVEWIVVSGEGGHYSVTFIFLNSD